uniref:Uncharacterized protein n=1 Tax=Timema monikensis TaxID=170555 RepID=A0A7R9E8C3_9NEOP|nr:unnamed protein product [Timema monikensis]
MPSQQTKPSPNPNSPVPDVSGPRQQQRKIQQKKKKKTLMSQIVGLTLSSDSLSPLNLTLKVGLVERIVCLTFTLKVGLVERLVCLTLHFEGCISSLLEQKRVKHKLDFGSMAIEITDWYAWKKMRELSKVETSQVPGFGFIMGETEKAAKLLAKLLRVEKLSESSSSELAQHAPKEDLVHGSSSDEAHEDEEQHEQENLAVSGMSSAVKYITEEVHVSANTGVGSQPSPPTPTILNQALKQTTLLNTKVVPTHTSTDLPGQQGYYDHGDR